MAAGDFYHAIIIIHMCHLAQAPLETSRRRCLLAPQENVIRLGDYFQEHKVNMPRTEMKALSSATLTEMM